MRKVLIPILILSSFRVAAQQISFQQLLASAQSQDVIQAQKTLTVQQIQTKVQQSKRLPLIYGDANIQRNLIVPVTPVPAIAFDPNAQPGAIIPLRFATDWSSKAGLQLALDVFNPVNHAQIKESKINEQKASVTSKYTEQTFRNQLIDLYAQAVLAQSQLAVATENLTTYSNTYKILEERFRAGRLSEIEHNNALKKMYELEQLAQEAHTVLMNKCIALLPYMDVDFSATFSTNLNELLNYSANDYQTENSELVALDLTLNDAKLKNLNLQALPKLTINGYYGAQFFDNDLKLFNNNYWYGSSYVNLTLRLPITETYERGLQKKRLGIEKEILVSQLEAATQDEMVQQKQKQINVAKYQQKIQQLQKILVLMESNVTITNSKLLEGTILVNELNTAIDAAVEQQQKLWQAQYDYLQAVIN